MSIINTSTAPAKIIPPVSDTTNAMKVANTKAYLELKNAVIGGFRNVWNNPNYTPQQVLNNWGTDAVSLFNFSYLAQQILAVDPSWKMLTPPVPCTLNEDGTVTVNPVTIN